MTLEYRILQVWEGHVPHWKSNEIGGTLLAYIYSYGYGFRVSSHEFLEAYSHNKRSWEDRQPRKTQESSPSGRSNILLAVGPRSFSNIKNRGTYTRKSEWLRVGIKLKETESKYGHRLSSWQENTWGQLILRLGLQSWPHQCLGLRPVGTPGWSQ